MVQTKAEQDQLTYWIDQSARLEDEIKRLKSQKTGWTWATVIAALIAALQAVITFF